ncbi:bile acid:sodium symporter family protein [Janibacter sp. GXQ6167]|uniref:bile acid:sodium symporter family protein n=1 Tax=Janibacter sp. GXQ6167 TaxID=3240791 RepID=UPI00352623AB
MDSSLLTIGLPIALAVIMLGLGLDLTPSDFARVARRPKAVLVALACQIVLLPLVAFGLVNLFGLSPLLAVGFMLLAASPGGTTANLYSHLFRGDVALNITLTAINSVLAIITLPLVTNLALAYFAASEDGLTMQFGKVVQVFAIVLIPVGIGMLIRAKAPDFAARMDRPVRIASAILLLLVVLGAILGEKDNFGSYFAQVGLVSTLFCAISLTVGYIVPRLLGMTDREAIASGFEIGIHNSTLAIAMAVTVLGEAEMAVPPAVYGIVMFFVAAAFGMIVSRRAAPRTAV